MDRTPEQSERLARLRRDFGAKAVKPFAPNPKTGVMRVELPCQAGVWSWWFDDTGKLVDKALTGRLFTPPAREHTPDNAINN